MSNKLTSNVWPVRSGHADYKEQHKFDDVTRYNISTFNVAFYKDTPNRQGTPKRVSQKSQSFSRNRRRSGKEIHLGEIIKQAPFIERIYRQALNFKPRNNNIVFPIAVHSIKTKNAVYNDYHIRETNIGFARNTYGGFFTK
jgi:hypothetical protein